MSLCKPERTTEMASNQTVPLYDRGNDGRAGETNASDPQNREDKVNILLVDDRADKLLAVETIIAELGQNLVIARSGEEALRLLLHQDFAVILMDVHMPGMDGFETAALIRQRKRFEHTPIIFLTATTTSDTEAHASRGYCLGAVDYLLAPVLPDVLRTKVSVFVELFKKTAQIKRQAERLREIEAGQFNGSFLKPVGGWKPKPNAIGFSFYPSISWRLPASTAISNN